MKENIVLANKSLNKWCNTQDINYYEGIEALGNLFKWAVPKLTIEDDWVWEVLQEWFYNAMRNSNYRKDSTKSALALFWAIYKVIEEENRKEPVIDEAEELADLRHNASDDMIG